MVAIAFNLFLRSIAFRMYILGMALAFNTFNPLFPSRITSFPIASVYHGFDCFGNLNCTLEQQYYPHRYRMQGEVLTGVSEWQHIETSLTFAPMSSSLPPTVVTLCSCKRFWTCGQM